MIVFFQKIINLQAVASSYLTGPKVTSYDAKIHQTIPIMDCYCFDHINLCACNINLDWVFCCSDNSI